MGLRIQPPRAFDQACDGAALQEVFTRRRIWIAIFFGICCPAIYAGDILGQRAQKFVRLPAEQ
jgi:hypothetical protein